MRLVLETGPEMGSMTQTIQPESVKIVEKKTSTCRCMHESESSPMHKDPFKGSAAARGRGGCQCRGVGAAALVLSLRLDMPCGAGLARLPNGSGAEIKFRGCQSQLPSFGQPNKQSLVNVAIYECYFQPSKKQPFRSFTEC